MKRGRVMARLNRAIQKSADDPAVETILNAEPAPRRAFCCGART
jgi:hypothetical protein